MGDLSCWCAGPVAVSDFSKSGRHRSGSVLKWGLPCAQVTGWGHQAFVETVNEFRYINWFENQKKCHGGTIATNKIGNATTFSGLFSGFI